MQQPQPQKVKKEERIATGAGKSWWCLLASCWSTDEREGSSSLDFGHCGAATATSQRAPHTHTHTHHTIPAQSVAGSRGPLILSKATLELQKEPGLDKA